MYARQIRSEETYTLSEARQILEKERQEKANQIAYYTKQKCLGLLSVCASIAAPLLIDDGTALLFTLIMLPLGLHLILTRKKVIY